MSMSEEQNILVCGVGEAASAVARRLHGEGNAVTLYRASAPPMLRRRMCFADAWYDGHAVIDGIEARRADVSAEFLLGLQTREFIPLLRSSLPDVIERWPWDVIVWAEEDREPPPVSLRGLAGFTIGLGPGFVPGVDCDITVETESPDPGAILREGDVRRPPRPRAASAQSGERQIFAPVAGQFRTKVSIGSLVDAGAVLGFIGDAPVEAPVFGRILGLARKEQAVAEGAPIAEIALSTKARVAGVSDQNQLISRGVSFALEMESKGVELFSFENWR
jgi:xanthine dehydrogenase accessory factor